MQTIDAAGTIEITFIHLPNSFSLISEKKLTVLSCESKILEAVNNPNCLERQQNYHVKRDINTFIVFHAR